MKHFLDTPLKYHFKEEFKKIKQSVFKETVGIMDIFHMSKGKISEICTCFPSYFIDMSV